LEARVRQKIVYYRHQETEGYDNCIVLAYIGRIKERLFEGQP